MRRPPQPWESKLARLTSIIGGAGIKSSGDGTSIVAPTPTPGTGGGTEPAPVLPPPGAFIKPSTPQLVGQVQGINVLWDGLNSASELWPYDTSWVEIHMSTGGTGFTPGTATLRGRLARPGAYTVGGLAAGTAYYFKLRGADPAGNYTAASDAATGYTGLTSSGDYGTATIGTGAVSFNARTIGGVTNTVGSTAPSSPIEGDIWLDSSPGTAIIHKVYNGSSWVTNAWGSASIAAGQITALQIAAGAITAGAIAAGAVTTDKLTAGTISGFYISGGTISGGYISGGTISGGYITGGTVDGSSVRTASSGARIEIGTAFSAVSQMLVYGSSSQVGSVGVTINGDLGVLANSGKDLDLKGDSVNITGVVEAADTVNCNGALDVDGQTTLGASGSNAGLRVASTGEVYSYGIEDNTTANAANVRVGASAQLLKSTSSVRRKSDLAPIDDDLAGVSADKLSSQPASVNPYDVLALTPTEFQSLSVADADARAFGFIAEDVAAKFPWACDWDETGQPDSVQDRPIIAALVQVVKDLTARIDALEGN